ncbi:hypothetical protein B0H13DRAFT_1867598 [Mycena leptocephala]|nr:hypothetical protein B0H13DRAFT_1867598 [Mycena leptocephala]
MSSEIFVGVPVHVLVIKLFDFNSSSRRAQETASPESGHTPRNAEGCSICIKAEKIVGDRGPKGMRDSKPAGQPSSSVVDPLCHADIGEPRPEVWTYFRGEPARSCSFDSGFSLCMLPRLANRVAVPFFSPPGWPIPTERDLEIVEAEEQMSESLIHTEVTAQDTL